MTRLVVIGDLHTGSIFGLNPRNAVSENRDNAWLQWVFEQWADFSNKFKNPEYLLLLGDLTDGSQQITLGTDALVTSLDEQTKLAVALLSMIKGPDSTMYGVGGSDYHIGGRQATSTDRNVVEALGGTFKGSVFEFEVGNELIQIAHHVGTSLDTPSSGITSEVKRARLNAQKLKKKAPTIIIRGHAHRSCGLWDETGCYGVVNGCWQYVTPFMYKRSSNVTPSIGATVIDVEEGYSKAYPINYPIPESVYDAMAGFEVLKMKESKVERLRLMEQRATFLRGR